MQAATEPPGLTTRFISPTPRSASVMKLTTSCAKAASNESSSNGSSSAAATRTSAVGSRALQTETNGWDGSTAATFSWPTTSASAVASPPGPQPTSSTRLSGSRPTVPISAAASDGA